MIRRRRPVGALLALWAAAAVVWWAAPAERAMAQTVPDTTPVNIPDANLRALLETRLGKAAGATITRAEMAAHTGYLWGAPPRRTQSFDHANWNSHLIHAPISSIPTPTAPATVIRDLTGLEYLTAIQGLRMIRNRITDLRPLAGLTEMRRLWLDENLISDLSPLRGLPLDQLSLKLNPVSDLSPLAGMVWLANFNCDKCQISDISPLAGLTRLTYLDLQNNYISDISPLTRVNDLAEVFLSDNRISDLSPLANRNLRTLAAAGNRITDLSPLRNSLAMETLDLNGNQGLRDVSVVERMVALKVLRLEGTDVRDLSPLVANTGLGSGDQVYLRNLPNLNADAEQHVATLRGRGVNVRTSSPLRVDKTVRGVAVTPGVERLTVTWNPPTVGYTPGFQRVYWWFGFQDRASGFTPPQHHDVPGDASSYTIPNLTPGVVYKVQIYPLSPTGYLSAIASGIPLAPPATEPDAVTVRPGVESLIVSWVRVANASGYKLQWKSGERDYDPAARQAQVAGADATRYTVAGLTAGTEYTVRVIPTRADLPDAGPLGEATGTPLAQLEVTVADAVVVEGEEAEIRVALDRPVKVPVTVTWTTADGTARAGADYRAQDGRLTFQPGAEEASFKVTTLDDRQVEPAETFRVLLTGTEQAAVTVTITDDDAGPARARALGMVLAGMGRWAAADAVEVIAGRFDDRRIGADRPAAQAQVSLAGQPLALPGGGSQAAASPAAPAPGALLAGYRLEPGRPSLAVSPTEWSPAELSPAELIAQSRFDLPVGRQVAGAQVAGAQDAGAQDAGAQDAGAPGDGPPGLRVWGRGTAGGFAGRPAAGSSADGGVAGGYLGIDFGLRHDLLMGVAFAHSRGGADYAIDSVTSGKADLSVTSVLPYAHWRPHAGLGVWSLLGVGVGGAALQDEAGRVETDLLMWMAAAGLWHEMATWREIDVALHADAFLTDWMTGARAGLPHVTVEAWRLRLRLEGSRPWDISPVSRLTPSVEVGGRLDGGGIEYGLGLEVGGGLAWTQSDLGLQVEAQGRSLLAHQKGVAEWGGGLTAKFDPGQAGLGPWLTFASGWGREQSQAARMWESRDVFGAGARADSDGAGQASALGLSPDRLALEAGYGVATDGAGLLTPYAGLSMAGSEVSAYRLGARLQAGSRMSLSLEGRQSPAAGYAVMLNGQLDW